MKQDLPPAAMDAGRWFEALTENTAELRGLRADVAGLKTEMHRMNERVTVIERSKDQEAAEEMGFERGFQKAKEQLKAPEFRQEKSWGDVIKENPGSFVLLFLGSLSIAALVIVFMISRDPSTAGKLVDKIPARELSK